MVHNEIDDWGELESWGEEDYEQGKDEDGNLKLDDQLMSKFVEKTFQVIEKIEKIGLPEKNKQLRIITMQIFNTIAIVSHVCKTEIVKEAIFVIFAINQYAARILIDLKKKGRIEEAIIIVSSIRNAGHKSKSKAVDLLKEHFEIIYVNSHAKITILKTDKGNFYNIEGSGNFSFNGRIEQYIIDNDEDIYNFSKKWMVELKKYKQKELIR